MATATKGQTTAPVEVTTTKKNFVDVSIASNWLQLIRYCGSLHQAGQIGLKIEGGIPMRQLDVGTKKDIRFKDPLPPMLFVREHRDTVYCRITNKWNNLIVFCKTRVPYGQICISVSGGEPDKLIEKYSKHEINFGHPESFPQVFQILNEYQEDGKVQSSSH